MAPNRCRAVLFVAVAVATSGGLGACTTDPFDRYANTIYRDLDGSAHTLVQTVARLQLMVVHGHMPLDSTARLVEIFGRAEKDIQLKAADFSRVTPPDSDLYDIHHGLSEELHLLADSVTAVSSAVATCARPPGTQSATTTAPGDSGMDSATAAAVKQAAYEDSLAVAANAGACRATLGGALGQVSNGVSDTRDLLRWGRQRAARKLATHGVLLRSANDLSS